MIKLGLTSKLAILLTCIGIVASGATGYYAYRANRSMLVQEAQHSLLMSTQLLGHRFIAALGDIADDALVLAAMPSSVKVALGGHAGVVGRDRLEQVYYNFMDHHPEYLDIRLVTREQFGLERIHADRGEAGIAMVPENELQEKGQFPYVFDTLSTTPGHVYLSPIGVRHMQHGSASETRPVVRIGTPVVGPDGVTVGALVIDVDLTRVFKRLERDLPVNYAVYLTNEWGDFLLHPDPAQTFGFDRGRRVLMQESFPATRPLFDTSRTSLTLDGLADPAQAGNQVLAFAHAPFGLVDDNRFIVLGLARPLGDVLVPADELGGRIVRMVLVSSLLAAALAILFARALTRPLQTLAHAATHVFDAADAERLPVSRSDEIGTLARCFDCMRKEIHSQMTVLRVRQQELTHLAEHDPLTGLANRILFMEQIDTAIRHASATGERLAVMFIDLDRFKEINDRHGHAAGDQALVVVAQRLGASLRSGDVAARLGGDEFIVLVRGVGTPDVIVEIAARIRHALSEEMEVGGRRVVVDASIGVSEYPVDGHSSEELLIKADAAMYAAKTSLCASHICYREMLGVVQQVGHA